MWEYTEVSGWVNNVEDLILQLNAHGALGWEAIGVAASDKTIGLTATS